MTNELLDTIRLQLAMAFGQGAGSMMADAEALTFALSAHRHLIEQAAGDWKASRPAFIELVRVLGQIAATRAALDGTPQIEKRHVEAAIPAVLKVCPCRK